MMIFNICDTIGRYGPSYLKLEKGGVGVLIFLRFIFLLTFSLIAIGNNSAILGVHFT
jgi:hypothetical protein